MCSKAGATVSLLAHCLLPRRFRRRAFLLCWSLERLRMRPAPLSCSDLTDSAQTPVNPSHQSRRQTNLWREVNKSRTRAEATKQRRRRRGAISCAANRRDPLRGERCRSSPPFGGAIPRERAGMRTIVRASIVALALACCASAFAQPGCVIKGNISSSGERIYHVPGQRYYDKTLINEHQGERWFCTEQEAMAAGWRKAKV